MWERLYYPCNRSKYYDTTTSISKGKEISDSYVASPLHIDKPTNDTMPWISKGVLKKAIYNPNVCAS